MRSVGRSKRIHASQEGHLVRRRGVRIIPTVRADLRIGETIPWQKWLCAYEVSHVRSQAILKAVIV
jgi:hypothetical protein